VLHAQLAAEEGTFDLTDVYRTLGTKIVRRHPHVFGDVAVSGVDQVVANWETIKSAEREDAGRPGASFADVDNDGDPDLFVTSVRTGNLLFRNDGKGHFTDVTARAGVAGNEGHAGAAVFFDYDGDGRLDLLVVDMHSPGVEVRPLRQITGEAEFNEIFFTGVQVPAENVLGEIGAGWGVAMTTLLHERGTLGFALQAVLEVQVRKLAALARDRGADGRARARRHGAPAARPWRPCLR